MTRNFHSFCVHFFKIQETTTQNASRCTKAQDALMSMSACGNAFFAFQNAYFAYSAAMNVIIERNLNTICQQASCRNAVSEYLGACRDIGDVS